jgi:hypothetical protein
MKKITLLCTLAFFALGLHAQTNSFNPFQTSNSRNFVTSTTNNKLIKVLQTSDEHTYHLVDVGDSMDFDLGPGIFNVGPSVAGYYALVLARYDEANNLVWAKPVATGAGVVNGYDMIELDTNIIVTGTADGTVNLGPVGTAGANNNFGTVGSFIAAYSKSSGSYTWSKRRQTGYVFITKLLSDKAGRINCLGYVSGSGDVDFGTGTVTVGAGNPTSQQSTILLQLNDTGAYLSHYAIAAAPSAGSITATAFTVGGFNTIYAVATSFVGVVSDGTNTYSNSGTVAKSLVVILGGGLNVVSHTILSSTKFVDVTGVALVPVGPDVTSYIVSGNYEADMTQDTTTLIGTNATNAEMFMLKLDMNQKLQWSRNFTGPGTTKASSMIMQYRVIDGVLKPVVSQAVDMYNATGQDFDPGPDTSIVSSAIAAVVLFMDTAGNYIGKNVTAQLTSGVVFTTPITPGFNDIAVLGYNFQGQAVADDFPYMNVVYINAGGGTRHFFSKGIIYCKDTIGISANGEVLTGTFPNTSTGDVFTWVNTTAGQTIPNSNSNTYTATSSASYAVIVKSQNCKAISKSVSVALPNAIVAVANESNIELYPNPASTILYVLGTTSNTAVSVVNTYGQKVITKTLSNASAEAIDIERLAAGVYYLVVSENGVHKSTKFVKN